MLTPLVLIYKWPLEREENSIKDSDFRGDPIERKKTLMLNEHNIK